MNESAESQAGAVKPSRRGLFTLVAIAILALGFGLAGWMIATSPKATPKDRPKSTPIVDVADVVPGSAQVRIEAMGKVMAADATDLQAEVSGRIVWVHPELVEGGLVPGDTILIKIDDRDYTYALESRRAALAKAESDLRQEQGRRKVADFEWDVMRESDYAADADADLARREPQLKAARAAVASARADAGRAELELSRTRVRAPFDAVIAQAAADVGDRAAPGIVLTRLINTNTFYVKASVPTGQVKWLRFPESDSQPGSTVIIHPSSGGQRTGRLLKLAPELTDPGRMAQVIVSVSDPLGRREGGPSGALLLGDFVQAEITGATLDNVIRLPRTALREGESVWLLDPAGRLRIFPVTILWSTSAEVFISSNLPANHRLIVSSLAAPVEGMSLAVEGEDRPEPGPGSTTERERPPR